MSANGNHQTRQRAHAARLDAQDVEPRLFAQTFFRYALVQNTLLALLYFLAALVGRWQPLLTDYASAVWPPSGVALAGLLIFGRSRWVGVWAGAFVTNIHFVALAGGTTWLAQGPLLQSVAISTGSVLAALTGEYLVRRFTGQNQWYANGSALLKLLLLGGPVSCAVAAVAGTLSLLAGGIITREAALFNALTWWVGDSIGVLLMTPIMLLWAPAASTDWREIRTRIGAGLLLLLVVVALILGNANKSNFERVELALHERTALMAKDIETRFDLTNDLLHAVAIYAKLVPNLDRAAFEAFTQPLLARYPGIQALEWVPIVTNAERSHFERRARQWYPDFSISERTADKKSVHAGPRAQYYPVTLVSPYMGNEKAVGFDLGSSSSRLVALERARDTGQATATGTITLIQENGEQKAILIFVPIYKTNVIPTTAEARREAIVGFVLGVFRIGDWLNVVLENRSGPAFSFAFFDNFSLDKDKLIFQSNDIPEPSARDISETIRVADRKWQIRYYVRNAPELTKASATAWLTLVAGLLFTVLVEAFVLLAAGRENFTRQLVAHRTSELRASEGRMRAILDTALDGIITIDRAGVIQSANPAAERLFGYQEKDILGRNVNMLMPEPDHSAHDGYLRAYLETGHKKIIGKGREVTGLRKNGSTFPMDLAVSETETENGTLFTGVVRDITERKRLERMKSEFVSMVSHELRTPLTSIRGALNLLLKSGLETPPENVRTLLEIADRNGERLSLLINDILDMEKIESNKLEFDFKKADLVSLVRRAIQDNEEYARKHAVSLTLDTAVASAYVTGDEHRLLQVLANLISNAVKFSPSAGQVELTLGKAGNGFRVNVLDRGPGIPDAFRQRMFQRFAQADSSDARGKGGTGLGLNISKALIERHHGSIGYEPREGGGSVFFFELPSHG